MITRAAVTATVHDEYIIVEFNTAARPPEVDLPAESDPKLLRKVIEDDQKQAEKEQNYVQAKVQEWKSRFSLEPSGIERLHTAGTSPFVIEASHNTVISLIADATWDRNINVMKASELFDFDGDKLNSIFKTSDNRLLGEFVGSHFKHEIMFSVWRAMNAPRAFSDQSDVYQNFAKNVSSLALAKLDRLQKFLRVRKSSYRADLARIDGLAAEILTGFIRVETLPESALFPTRSSFFEALKFFDDLGHRILLTNELGTDRIADRWIAFHSRALMYPRIVPNRLPSHGRVLSLLGHRSASVRHKFKHELIKLVLDYEDQREVFVRGVPEDRFLRMALSVALERETAERFQAKTSGSPQLDGRQQLERRFQIAQDLLRPAHPDVNVFFGNKKRMPPNLLVDIIDEMVHLDFKGTEFDTNFSVYHYRLAALQILNSIIANSRNAEFRRYVNRRTMEWFYRLRSTEQSRGLEPNMAIIEYNMKTGETRRTCEGLFRSTD